MKLIIFDMDGTLVDSGVMIANTINYVRENEGLEKLEKDVVLQGINNPHINPAEFFYGTSHFTDKQTVLFEEYYHQNCVKDVTVYEGIRELLENLKGEFRMSVATNASTVFADKILSHVGLVGCFDKVFGADSVEKPKPEPDMLLKTMQELDIKPKNSILIGDSHKDILAANRADIKSILVNWGFSDHKGALEKVSELEEKIFKTFSGDSSSSI